MKIMQSVLMSPMHWTGFSYLETYGRYSPLNVSKYVNTYKQCRVKVNTITYSSILVFSAFPPRFWQGCLHWQLKVVQCLISHQFDSLHWKICCFFTCSVLEWLTHTLNDKSMINLLYLFQSARLPNSFKLRPSFDHRIKELLNLSELPRSHWMRCVQWVEDVIKNLKYLWSFLCAFYLILYRLDAIFDLMFDFLEFPVVHGIFQESSMSRRNLMLINLKFWRSLFFGTTDSTVTCGMEQSRGCYLWPRELEANSFSSVESVEQEYLYERIFLQSTNSFLLNKDHISWRWAVCMVQTYIG